MAFTPNAIKVLEKRYLAKDEKGNLIETPEDMLHRVANSMANADAQYGATVEEVEKTSETFYKMMEELRFLPNSPTLMNAGRPLGQLSACFVLPIEDSMEGIFTSIKNAALIHKSGGGTGFSFSRLRGAGSVVNSTGGVASGPVSFMKVFNAATEAVKQGGTRRGANMGILRVDHPDILSFISCKQDNTEITNFNISIGLTDKFVKAVKRNKDYELIDPKTKEIVKKLNARKVYDLIVNMAWRNGEPGIVFIDRMNKANPTPKLGEFEATNPCGEQPLLPFESCNLGSINLAKMLKKTPLGDYVIDYDLFRETIRNSVHFLDNVIDMNNYPLEEIDKQTKLTRKIGLGVMGFADMLFMLGIPYNSDEAVDLAEDIMSFMNDESKKMSTELANVRGPFPAFKDSIYKNGAPIRNATTTTIAPTGTISILAGASSGVEPLFAIAFVKNVMDNDQLIEMHPFAEEILKKNKLTGKKIMTKLTETGNFAHIEEIPEEIKKVFVTAHEVTPEWHIKIQGAFQRFTDNAVSKTINFNNSATVEDVSDSYMLAYDEGCKGLTIYRDGSRDSQVLTVAGSGNKPAVTENKDDKRERPALVKGITEKVKVGCGNLYVTVNYDENGICEVFTNVGKAGGCPSQSEASARLVSIALRGGADVNEIIEQLRGIRCHSTIRAKGKDCSIGCLSCPDAMARTIEKLLKTEDFAQPVKVQETVKEPEGTHKCPDCGAEITHEGGCVICKNCGFSKCG
jgi:ribonucleoside-diphosphate reductase alpha chain